jgi:hypothetical protein
MRNHEWDLSTRECRHCHAPKSAVEDGWVPAECIGGIGGRQGWIIIDEFAFFQGSTVADSDGDDGE